jgi:hypothetical protein
MGESMGEDGGESESEGPGSRVEEGGVRWWKGGAADGESESGG